MPTIRSITTVTNASATASISVTSSESPSATRVGDVVCVWVANDFYTLSTFPANPTATGTPTFTQPASCVLDAGTNTAHQKVWFYNANTAGAQTVSATFTGTHDEERAITVIVYSKDDTAPAAQQPDTAATVSTGGATGVHPTGVASLAAAGSLIYCDCGGAGSTSGTYTWPSPPTEIIDQAIASWGYTFAKQENVAAGSYGSYNVTDASNQIYNILTIPIKGLAAAVAPPLRVYNLASYAAHHSATY